jgi:hypothetical protein
MDHQYDEAVRVLNSTALQNQTLSILSSTLQLREHQDFGTWLEDLEAIRTEFGNDAPMVNVWEAHIANRDFAAAEKVMDGITGSEDRQVSIMPSFSNFDLYPVITHWFSGNSSQLIPVLDLAEKRLEETITSNGGLPNASQTLELALVTAAGGDDREAQRLVRAWRRLAEEDQAELPVYRHLACRALGMANAAGAATECIREGLVEPSYVMPFMEPYLPYYDSIRQTPEFVGLMAEIGTN